MEYNALLANWLQLNRKGARYAKNAPQSSGHWRGMQRQIFEIVGESSYSNE